MTSFYLSMKEKCFFRMAHELVTLLWERDYRYRINQSTMEQDRRIDALVEGNLQLQEACTLLLVLNTIPDPRIDEMLDSMIEDD